VYSLGGDMADTHHRRTACPHIAYMPQGLGKNRILLHELLELREATVPLPDANVARSLWLTGAEQISPNHGSLIALLMKL
jgi:hypothetical protein